jgi:hypothetical protein
MAEIGLHAARALRTRVRDVSVLTTKPADNPADTAVQRVRNARVLKAGQTYGRETI